MWLPLLSISSSLHQMSLLGGGGQFKPMWSSVFMIQFLGPTLDDLIRLPGRPPIFLFAPSPYCSASESDWGATQPCSLLLQESLLHTPSGTVHREPVLFWNIWQRWKLLPFIDLESVILFIALISPSLSPETCSTKFDLFCTWEPFKILYRTEVQRCWMGFHQSAYLANSSR